jgi:large subunit ribosomal protein L32
LKIEKFIYKSSTIWLFNEFNILLSKTYLQKLKAMAVPKKRTSKAKKNARKANWKRKGYKAAQKSLSLAKSMLRGKTTSFVYSIYVEENE